MLSLLQMCAAGYWFCNECERVSELRDDNRGGNCCALCGSARIEFREAVLPAPAEEQLGGS